MIVIGQDLEEPEQELQEELDRNQEYEEQEESESGMIFKTWRNRSKNLKKR